MSTRGGADRHCDEEERRVKDDANRRLKVELLDNAAGRENGE